MHVKIIPSPALFSKSSSFYSLLLPLERKKPPKTVCLSCLLFRLSMNEIIISHEKFSSENKRTSLAHQFSLWIGARKNLSQNFLYFRSFRRIVKGRMRAFIAGNFYYLVIRFVLSIIRRILQTHNIMIILFLLSCSLLAPSSRTRYSCELVQREVHNVIRMGYRRDMFYQSKV